MATFNDKAGRAWTVAVNVDAIKRVRSLLGVDLMDAVGGELLERLVADPVLLCDVIYALCKPEADARSVSDEEFGRAMAGDAIEAATTALLEELTDFFPSRRRRLLKRAMEKMDRLQELALQAAEARLESGEFEERLRAELESGNWSGNSPGSSGSTPDR